MRALAVFKQDVQFQFRHGFYYAYLIVCAAYVLFLREVPAWMGDRAATLIISSDPGVLGFFFVGGLLMLERNQNILDNLFVTPLLLREYFLSKVLSLALLAIVTSVGVTVFSFGTDFQLGPLLVGVVLSSAFFTLLGVTLAVKVKSINQFLLTSTVYLTVLFIPVLGEIGVWETPLYLLFPTRASLALIGAAFGEASLWELLFSTAVLAAWIALAYSWAKRAFARQVLEKIGGGLR